MKPRPRGRAPQPALLSYTPTCWRISFAATRGSVRWSKTRSVPSRRLVRVVDAGEPGARRRAPWRRGPSVARLAHVERRVDEHLEERQAGGLVEHADLLPTRPVRADEGHEGDDAGVGEEAGDLGDPPHVLGPAPRREAEIPVQPVAKVVAVEQCTSARHAR